MRNFTLEQRLLGGFGLGLAATIALSIFLHGGPLPLLIAAAMGGVLLWITRREIVGRNRAETAHLAADSRLNLLLANAPFILYSLTPDGIYTMLEGKGLEAVKLKPGQFVGQSIHDLYKDDPELLNTLQSALRGEISEGLLIRKGRTYHTSFFLSAGENGKRGELTAISSDITEHLHVQTSLTEQTYFLRSILDADPSLVFVKDFDGRYSLANRAIAELYGTTIENLTGKRDVDFLPDPGDPEQYCRDDREVIETRQEKYVAEESMTDLQGNLLWFETFKRPFFSPDGQCRHVLGICNNITERKRAEDALREIQHRLNLVIGNAPLILFAVNADGVFTLSKGKGLETLGLRPSEVVGLNALEFYAEHPKMVADLRAALAGEAITNVIELDGKIFECRYVPVQDEQGRPAGIVGVNTDVTERQKSQRQVQNTLALLSATLESTEDGILVVGTDNKRLSANRRFYELWRIDESIRETQTEEERFHHVMSQVADPEAFRARVGELYAQPEAEGFDVVSCVDGRLFERYSRPLIVEGTPTGRVWSFRDVTQREQARRDLEQAKDQSQKTLALLSATLESTEDGVLVMGNNNEQLTTNQRFYELWRIDEPLRETQTSKERLDHVMRQLVDPEGFRARVAYLYANPEAESFDVISFLDGRLFERYSRPLFVDNASVGRVWSFRDVTRREQARRDLEQAKDQALASTKAKSDFLANMSHEIRTPMNGVLGMTTLLMNTPLEPKQRHFAQTIRHSADSLLAIINDILDFSKIEAGCMTLDTLAFDLHEVVAEVIALLVPRAQEKGLRLTSLLDADFPPALLGDPGRLRQILTNLVGNAVKFTADGAVTVTVRLERQDAGRAEFRMEVRDTGVGIVPQRLHDIFESFTQADNSTTRKFGGTGLGLTICRQLVELMGGRIDVQSEIGVGSVFSVALALEKPVTIDVGADVPTLVDLRVLLADSDAESSRALAGRLRAWGCRVEESPSAADALARLRDAATGPDPFRLALLDRQLSLPSGDALAVRVRREAALFALPLLLLSDEAVPGASLRSLGISACLARPVRQSSLFDSLLALFGPLPDDAPASIPMLAAPDVSADVPDSDALGLRVLLVEDNEINQEVALAFLEGWECAVDVAGNGKIALDILAADDDYAVVLMDLQMPEMGGIEATGEIRKRERETGRRLPIIAMTAHNMTGDRENCLENGMDDHVAKPIDPPDLRDALIRWGRRAPKPTLENKPMIQERENFSDEPVMNWDRLHLSCGGKPALEKRVVSTYLKVAPDGLMRLGEAVRAVDAEQIRFEAHTLKGSSRTVGAEAVGAVCAELEQRAKSGTLDDAQTLFAHLRDEWARLQWLLEAFVEEAQAA